jgi:hypothetical protein
MRVVDRGSEYVQDEVAGLQRSMTLCSLSLRRANYDTMFLTDLMLPSGLRRGAQSVRPGEKP